MRLNSLLIGTAIYVLGIAPGELLAQERDDRTTRSNGFVERTGDNWNIVWNERRDLPERVFMGQTRAYPGTGAEIARAFLRENASLFRMEEDLANLEIVRINERKGYRHVSFQQTVDGIPIEDAIYKVHITPDNRVDMANGSYLPKIWGDRRASLDLQDAVRIAVAYTLKPLLDKGANPRTELLRLRSSSIRT